MQTKYDLKRMLREIAEETGQDAAANVPLSQAEIKQRIAAKKTAAPAPGPKNPPAPA